MWTVHFSFISWSPFGVYLLEHILNLLRGSASRKLHISYSMYSIPRFYTCLKPTVFFRLADTENSMVTVGRKGSTGAGELEDQLLEARWVQRSAVQYEEHSQCFILTVNGKWSLKIVLKVKKEKPTTYKLHDFLSGLVIQYLFGLKEKLSFQSFWLLSLKKADLLGAVSLPWGESDGSLEVRDWWIERSTSIWELCGNELNWENWLTSLASNYIFGRKTTSFLSDN